MRKRRFFGILLLLVFAACKKDGGDAPSSYYMYMDFAEASHVSFDDSVLTAIKNTNAFALQINAYSKTNGNIRIALNDTIPATYTVRAVYSDEKNIYYFSVNRLVRNNGNMSIQSGFLSNTVSVPMTLTITAINSNYVEGYFGGNLSTASSINGIAITNGKFKVPF